MLNVNNIHHYFGGLKAIDGADFIIKKGTITGLIGANGAGKTTIFNIIAGLYTAQQGNISLNGEDITGLPPHQLFHKGLLRSFQIAHEFSTLSVMDNLMMVPPNQSGEILWKTWLQRQKIKHEESQIRDKANHVIDFLNLNKVKNEKAGNLSGGQKKLLELGRIMMVDAKIILLDEIAAGVNRTLLNHIADAILRLNQEYNYTFCMIEHDMEFIGKLCHHVIAMGQGKVICEGTLEQVKNNDAVIESYLGASHQQEN